MRPPDRLALTVAEVLRDLVRRPHRSLFQRWNWKSAVLSSAIRASLFFATNLPAGSAAALSAAGAELLFRAATSGFYGAITEALARVRPARSGTVAAVVLVPSVSHVLEFLLHYSRGTPELASSLLASVALTILSTTFNLFAMRHGVLIVGKGRRSMAADLARIPALMLLFISHPFRSRAGAVPDRCP